MPYKVIFSSPTWGLSGVNTAASNLIRDLLRLNVDARFLLTNPKAPDPMPMPPPSDVPIYFLPARPGSGPRARRKALAKYLEELAPCIYIPGYDFDHSCICPMLSDQVMVVGVVHSDDPVHYEHVERLGAYWNAIVCVSQAVAQKVQAKQPELASRIHVIPSGVAVTSVRRGPGKMGAPLRLVYTGRLVQHQKRVMDLASIANRLEEKKVPFTLTIIGGGPQEEELKKALDGPISRGVVSMTGTLPNDQVLRHLVEHDVLLLTSDFEGTPVSLLEAMAAACVPVVTDIESGIPELVEDGVSGHRVKVGDIDAFADRLQFLAHDPEMRTKMANEARETIRGSRYATEKVTRSYLEVFGIAEAAARTDKYKRPKGKILRPPGSREGLLSMLRSFLQG